MRSGSPVASRRGIVAARPLHTTRELVDVIRASIPAPARRRGGHPARRTFQAIRMEVNRELPNLADGLDDSVHVIGPEGRVLVLAYHSLEDRMVKETFADWADTGSAPASAEARDPGTAAQSVGAAADPAAAPAACRRGGRQSASRERPSAAVERLPDSA